MRAERGRGSLRDLARWPPQAAPLLISVAPVVVGTAVAAHFGLVPAGRTLGTLGVSLSLGLGLRGLVHGRDHNGVTLIPRWPGLGQVPRSTVAWLAIAAALGVWLAATTAWWLLGLAALGLASAMILAPRPAPTRFRGLEQLTALAAAELLVVWATVWVELGRLPSLGLVAAILPASLATGLLLLAEIRDLPTDLAAGRLSAAAGIGERASQRLLRGLLALSLAVPLLITVPGLDGAECFLPWLLAPLAEGPLRNSTSADPALRCRAVRQMELLLVGGCALLAIGIWAG